MKRQGHYKIFSHGFLPMAVLALRAINVKDKRKKDSFDMEIST
jgi:hypothetical protein